MSARTRRQLLGRVGMSGFRSRVVASGVRRTAVILALALPAATWVIIAGAAPDALAAPTCSLSSHCYAIAYNKNTATNHGIFGTLNAHCLYQPNDGTFVTNEIWDVDSSASYWEEVGLFSGDAGGNIGYGNKNWFWDDSRPGGGYHQHDSSTTANTDTDYRTKVEFEGNGTWYIYGNGDYSHFGTSTSQSATLITGEAGTEYTNSSTSGIRDQGHISNLQRKSSSDTWYSWGSNAARYYNGYITPSYDSSTNSVSWSGPC